MKLFLCEKPSQGKDIAKVVGAKTRGDGCYTGNGITVTWCIGHLIEAVQPESYDERYKTWSLEDLPIIPVKWKNEVKKDVAKQFKIVKKLLSEADELVIATDADREGEMIARELIDYCRYTGPIKRLWLSALNDSSIRKALNELKSGNETLPLYYSALTRSRADWLIGMNLSRLFTLLARQAGLTGVMSVGRVQTPTLNLIVKRDREIVAFVSKPYWNIDVSLTNHGQKFIAKWLAPDDYTDDSGRCITQSLAQSTLVDINAEKLAIVENIATERIKEAAPLVFDLSTLQEICSKQLGLDVQETLDIAQSLYEKHKATTYPRSDCGYLPENMLSEVPAVMKALIATDSSLEVVIRQLDFSLRSKVWNDTKITAHHGIIPTSAPVDLKAMSDKELAVYTLIRTYYLAQFLANHEYDRTKITLKCASHHLETTGKQIVVQGWRYLMLAATEENDSQTLPAFTDKTCQVLGAEIKALKTLPPKPYTQGELVKAMKSVAKFVTDPRLKKQLKETSGIGTEATRAGIIKSLLARGYLEKKGKAIRATHSAFTLIEAVPPEIADPGMTALWEQALKAIEDGTMTLESFLDKQAQWLTQLINQYGVVTLNVQLPESPPCPNCGAKTRKISGKNGDFWSCTHYPECKGTVPIKTKRKRTK